MPIEKGTQTMKCVTMTTSNKYYDTEPTVLHLLPIKQASVFIMSFSFCFIYDNSNHAKSFFWKRCVYIVCKRVKGWNGTRFHHSQCIILYYYIERFFLMVRVFLPFEFRNRIDLFSFNDQTNKNLNIDVHRMSWSNQL